MYTEKEAERVYDLCVPHYLADNSLGLFRRTMEELEKQNRSIREMQDADIEMAIKTVLNSAYK